MKIFYPPFSRDQVIQRLQEGVARLLDQLPVIRAVLFGSYARARHTVSSDIDLLIIYAGDPQPQAFSLVKKTLALPGLEPHLYTESEAAALKETIDRMDSDGIVIFQAEN